MTKQIREAIAKIWPRKPQQPTIPTAEQMKAWHYSQGPIKGHTYPKEQNEKN